MLRSARLAICRPGDEARVGRAGRGAGRVVQRVGRVLQRGAAPAHEPARRTPETDEMFKSSIERVARARLALPIVIVLAALAMFINEATYQHTTTTLARGIALTDARLGAARTQQAVTDLEAAARAYVATRDPTERERFERQARMLPQVQGKVFALVAEVDPQGAAAADGVRELIDDHVRRLQGWVVSVAQGAPVALDDAQSRDRSAAMAAALEALLTRAGAAQQQARVSLYDAFQLNRGAIHALIVLAVVALVLFARQLRRADAQLALEHERLESQIRARTAELRDLADHLVNAREDERRRLARELHDEMGGLLTAMKLELARLKRVPDLPPLAHERVAGFEKRVNAGISLKRQIVENLRPSSLDQLGLKPALEMLCRDTATISGLHIHTELAAVDVDKEIELNLYRVVQESLNNVIKYADAKQVWIKLQATADGLRLTVKDDGQGFDPSAVGPGHHGILGMRLRLEAHGGRLQVLSAAGSGSEVVASLPVQAPRVSAPSRVATG
jgi:signal transduction histidine kinase